MNVRKWIDLLRDAAALVRLIVRLFRPPRPPKSGQQTERKQTNGKN